MFYSFPRDRTKNKKSVSFSLRRNRLDGDDDDDDDKDDDDPDDRDCQGGRLLPEAPAAETGDRFSRSLRPTREARRGKIAICNMASKNYVVRNYF